MLSFQQKTDSSFAASSDECVSPAVHRNAARSLVIEAPDVQAHTLDSKVRRERYLTDLAARYVSRWDIVTGATATAAEKGGGSETVLKADVLERAFYASIPISFERRRNMAHNILSDAEQQARQRRCAAPAGDDVGSGGGNNSDKKNATAAAAAATSGVGGVADAKHGADNTIVVIDAGTECWSGTMLHDWALDAIRTDAYQIKGRPHVLCKYTHPCNDGASCVPVAEKAVPSAVATPAAAGTGPSGGCHRQVQGNYAYMNELRQRLVARHGAAAAALGSDDSGDASAPSTDGGGAAAAAVGAAVVRTVEKQLTKRRREQRRARERELEAAATMRKESEAVCNRLIARTRAMNSGRAARSSLHRMRSRRERRSLIVEDAGNYDDVDSVLTRSDDDEDDNDEDDEHDEKSASDEDDHNKCVAGGVAAAGGDNNGKDEASEDSGSSSATFSDEHVEAVTATATNNDGAGDVVPSVSAAEAAEPTPVVQCEREQVVRQSNAEMIIPICEPTDSFRFFEQLECPYVMQWADDDRRRLHIYRRYYVHVRTYLLYSQRETHFQLVTTIEVV